MVGRGHDARPQVWADSSSPPACVGTHVAELGRGKVTGSDFRKTANNNTNETNQSMCGWLLNFKRNSCICKHTGVTVTSSPSSACINLRDSRVLKGYFAGNDCSVKGYSSLTEIGFLLLNIRQSG